MLVGALIAGSTAAYVQMSANKEIPSTERRAERLPEHQDKKAGSKDPDIRESSEVRILKPKFEDGDLKYDKRNATVPAGSDKFVFAVNEFLLASKVAPEEARLAKSTLTDGNLKLEFNQAFDRTYGSQDEQTLVDGILRTLGQFPEVRTVQFTIEGAQMETLGHLDLSTPQAVLRD